MIGINKAVDNDHSRGGNPVIVLQCIKQVKTMTILVMRSMEKSDINLLLQSGKFPVDCKNPQLIETHISYVILCEKYVYKIKKPIQYHFLDFSTLEQRKYYCEREIELNKRLAPEIYIDILPIHKLKNTFAVNSGTGEIVDYAVFMKKMDPCHRMDVMLQEGKMNKRQVKKIAEVLVDFHKSAKIIYGKDLIDIRENFNDIGDDCAFLTNRLKPEYSRAIEQAITKSDHFLDNHKALLQQRSKEGMVRDVHGDLHSRNIFFDKKPIIFDCIEFNDDFRQIDILNELAFFCMDLEAFGKYELSQAFMEHYLQLSDLHYDHKIRELFIYYKAYRANVRAKVNCLRAKNERMPSRRKEQLREVEKYLKLMSVYLHKFD